MSLSTIQIGGQPVTLVSLPSRPGYRSVQFDYDDPAANVTSGFSGQSQIQRWPGAETLAGTLSLPQLTQADADEWISFLMACRGQVNAFLIGDPTKLQPRGKPQHSVPVVNGSNIVGSDQLSTRGWSGAGHLLEAGDWLQIGYRLYRNLFPVLSTGGTATLTVWPSLRESPADGASVVLHNPKGLFRLAQSKRSWSADFTRLTAVSFPVVEYRGTTYGT